MEEDTKLKISSDFIIIKIFLAGGIFILLLLLSDYKRTPSDFLLEYIISLALLLLLLYYVLTRPGIYYDKDNLYIEKKGKTSIKVPLANIQSINFSIIGFGQGGYSYRIKYVSEANEIKSVRVFPSILVNSFSKFISCVKTQNRKVEVNNASFGINELLR